jgi:type VI protein secretion system component Hcp
MRLAVHAAVVLVPVVLLSSCDEAWVGSSDRYKEDFHYSYPLAADGRVSLENINGGIEISAWEKNEIEINGTRYAPTEQALRDMKIEINAASDSVQIRTVPAYSFRNGGARYSIRVPQRARLERIVSTNGSIKIFDINGRVNLKTSNGAIRVSGVTGEVEARTSNGSIEATEQSGNAILHTSNGRIRAEVLEGALDASTSNGSMEIRLAGRDAERPVRLESSNGNIEVTMDATRDIRASTSNSSITLRLPDSANARVRARTSNSSINTDFQELAQSMESKKSLNGVLGGGGPLIDLATTNGQIRLLRR